MNVIDNNAKTLHKWLASLCLFLIMSGIGCANVNVNSANTQTLDTIAGTIPEAYRLDVAIQTLDANIESLPEEALSYESLREAESVWVADHIKQALETSNAWGVVRVVPDDQVITDIIVSGKIIVSNGQRLHIQLNVEDSTGLHWFERQYKTDISKYVYSNSQQHKEPFQGIYNQIANDMLAYLKAMDLNQRANVKKVTKVNFAAFFAPDAYNSYLVTDANNIIDIDRLPADNDPIYQRIADIQVRDKMFVDLLQSHYQSFTGKMQEPYQQWRQQSYNEVRIMEDLKASSRAHKIGGWLAVIGGVAAQFSDNSAVRQTGNIAIYGGVESIKTGYTKQDEALLHTETLTELGESLTQELEPNVIDLQNQTITLTGSVRNQYSQWQEILRKMYFAENETGDLALPPQAATISNNTEHSQ